MQSLTGLAHRVPEQMGYASSDVRAKPHASRIPRHPHMHHEGSSSDMGLERLATLRMDSGSLGDAALPPDLRQDMRSAHRMMAEPYSMRTSWDPAIRDGMHQGARPLMYEDEVEVSKALLA